MRCRILLLVTTLAGCAADRSDSSPSLLPRSIEQRSDAEPAPVVPVAAADPALDARIAEIDGHVQTAAAAFAAALSPARRAVAAARGAPRGSGPWLDAQIALGTLDAPRADTSAAATDLAQLAIARGTAGQPEYPALTAAERAAEAARDAQATTIADLTAALTR